MISTQRHRTSHGLASLRARRRGQGGMSLVEVLLAVVLMSIVVLGIAAGFRTTAKVSGDAGIRAEMQEALNTASDRVATLSYPGCAAASQISQTANAPGAHVAPDGFNVDIVAVDYLVPSGPCTATTSVLKLTVEVTSVRDALLTARSEVVLRNVAPRPA